MKQILDGDIRRFLAHLYAASDGSPGDPSEFYALAAKLAVRAQASPDQLPASLQALLLSYVLNAPIAAGRPGETS